MGIQFCSLHITEMTCILCINSTQVDVKTCHVVQRFFWKLLLNIPRRKEGLATRGEPTRVVTAGSRRCCEEQAAASGTRGAASRVTWHTLRQCQRPFLFLFVTKG